jgi:DinB family protein
LPPTTPYTADLAGRDPIEAMAETTAQIEALTTKWMAAQFEQTYAPGKWTARQILTHLAQTELALGARARMALTTPGYVAQPFDQDLWIQRESSLSGRDAAAAFATISRMNTTFYGSLSNVDRQVPFAHPEYGALTVDWLIHQAAGHQIHHKKQLETIAAR